jgi:error-prone DNA polymerase
VTFLNLEGETGMVNVLGSQRVWGRHRKLAQTASGLVIRGIEVARLPMRRPGVSLN